MFLFSLFLFVWPYIFFIAYHWNIPHFSMANEESISLLRALGLYIINGGQNISSNEIDIYWRSFGTFIILSIYNLARFVLLFQTKTLEYEREVTEMESIFSLKSPLKFPDKKIVLKFSNTKTWKIVRLENVTRYIPHYWQVMYKISSYGFWLAFLFGAYNFIHFMQNRIPLSAF